MVVEQGIPFAVSKRRGGRLPAVCAVGLVFAVMSAWAQGAPPEGLPALGAQLDATGKNVEFRVISRNAEKIDVYVFNKNIDEDEKATVPALVKGAGSVWSVSVPVADLEGQGGRGHPAAYYGYRAWGPNWHFQPGWTKGAQTGFVADVDGNGNRFNPNKLLLDPYALEVSHDPVNVNNPDGTLFASGDNHRLQDTGLKAPKGIVLPSVATDLGTKPSRPFRDDIVYEVHVRGLTKADDSIAEAERGTYAGAARKAAYLKDLGVTAVEFLPVQETPNDQNDLNPNGTQGDNYWGYMTFNYFAPDRRYARDQSPGGPTREFQAMVKAFHDQDLKVYIDVVYNHTGEGGIYRDHNQDLPSVANIFSWRGLDDPTYYELSGDARFYYDNTGVGGNFNTADPVVRDLILDSLRYWSQALGVDGFRFDLAPVLGNSVARNGFNFDKFASDNPLNRAVTQLPARPAGGRAQGVDLIAEPWALGDGTYQLGNFPSGWAEWNGKYRDSLRTSQNKLGVAPVTPAELARRFAGSNDLFQDDGRKPWNSVNMMAAHDGFTLRDLYSYNTKKNDQPFPFGPSDGGTDDNISWDQGGNQALQRQAARNGLAFLMLSAGVPMVTGGDEMYRTQFGNNNPYNLDSVKVYLNWTDAKTNARFVDFARRLIPFRRQHPALRPAEYFTGRDNNGNGLKDLTWYRSERRGAGRGLFRQPGQSLPGLPDRRDRIPRPGPFDLRRL